MERKAHDESWWITRKQEKARGSKSRQQQARESKRKQETARESKRKQDKARESKTKQAIVPAAPQSSLEAPKSRPGGSKIEPWGLQNRAWSPPRRNFEKRFNLRSLRGGGSNSDFCDFWPTWLHLGGPRGSKIEAKTLKNGCWKTSRFQHRF